MGKEVSSSQDDKGGDVVRSSSARVGRSQAAQRLACTVSLSGTCSPGGGMCVISFIVRGDVASVISIVVRGHLAVWWWLGCAIYRLVIFWRQRTADSARIRRPDREQPTPATLPLSHDLSAEELPRVVSLSGAAVTTARTDRDRDVGDLEDGEDFEESEEENAGLFRLLTIHEEAPSNLGQHRAQDVDTWSEEALVLVGWTLVLLDFFFPQALDKANEACQVLAQIVDVLARSGFLLTLHETARHSLPRFPFFKDGPTMRPNWSALHAEADR
ncbi:uncharacterized protein J3D65DRAFT_612006 [Phyllosticta citribraziliensis]|uniref:Transmembrane protein n=1 Tax=Phyllosticta citribraziliensis TaxID=989973 RepID=A0ABR1M2V4_9PEZI